MNKIPRPIETARLVLREMATGDAGFIQELVNTEGWLRFIGDRNVHSIEDAIAYIERINNSPNVQYYVVCERENNAAAGIITFIKRDYLEHHDIGFAFLPAYYGKGYAYEAAKAVLSVMSSQTEHPVVLATTLPGNTGSIALLKKLGFRFNSETTAGGDKLHVFRYDRADAP